MPIPKGYLPREGDLLLVPARVVYDVNPNDDRGEEGELQVFIRIFGDYGDRRIPLKHVVDVVSRKWNVGDAVVIDGDDEGGFGEVLAEHDGLYWLKYMRAGRTPTFATYAGKDLLPKPEQPDPVDEPFVAPAPPPLAPSRIDSDGKEHF